MLTCFFWKKKKFYILYVRLSVCTCVQELMHVLLPGTGGTIGCELPCGAGNPTLALCKSTKCSLVLSYFWSTQNMSILSDHSSFV